MLLIGDDKNVDDCAELRYGLHDAGIVDRMWDKFKDEYFFQDRYWTMKGGGSSARLVNDEIVASVEDYANATIAKLRSAIESDFPNRPKHLDSLCRDDIRAIERFSLEYHNWPAVLRVRQWLESMF